MSDTVIEKYTPGWATPIVRIERKYDYACTTSPLLEMFHEDGGTLLLGKELLAISDAFKEAHDEFVTTSSYKSYSGTVDDKDGFTYYTVTVTEGDTIVKVERPDGNGPYLGGDRVARFVEVLQEAQEVVEYNAALKEDA